MGSQRAKKGDRTRTRGSPAIGQSGKVKTATGKEKKERDLKEVTKKKKNYQTRRGRAQGSSFERSRASIVVLQETKPVRCTRKKKNKTPRTKGRSTLLPRSRESLWSVSDLKKKRRRLKALGGPHATRRETPAKSKKTSSSPTQ